MKIINITDRPISLAANNKFSVIHPRKGFNSPLSISLESDGGLPNVTLDESLLPPEEENTLYVCDHILFAAIVAVSDRSDFAIAYPPNGFATTFIGAKNFVKGTIAQPIVFTEPAEEAESVTND